MQVLQDVTLLPRQGAILWRRPSSKRQPIHAASRCLNRFLTAGRVMDTSLNAPLGATPRSRRNSSCRAASRLRPLPTWRRNVAPPPHGSPHCLPSCSPPTKRPAATWPASCTTSRCRTHRCAFRARKRSNVAAGRCAGGLPARAGAGAAGARRRDRRESPADRRARHAGARRQYGRRALSSWADTHAARTGLRTSFVCAADARLTQLAGASALAVFRVAQEALSNVAKHARDVGRRAHRHRRHAPVTDRLRRWDRFLA